jgi:hypothetical protein
LDLENLASEHVRGHASKGGLDLGEFRHDSRGAPDT